MSDTYSPVPGLGGMMLGTERRPQPPAPPIPTAPSPAMQELMKGSKCGSCNPCDPKCLPPIGPGPSPSGTPPINVPNKGILPTRAWVGLPTTGYPAVVVPLGTQTAPIFFAFKRTTADGETDQTVLGRDTYTWPRGGLLFAPGQWYAYNVGTADLEVVIREYACSEEAALAMMGLQIVGANGGAATVGDFDSAIADERVLALFTRAALTALDGSLGAGARNVPLTSRLIGTNLSAFAIQGLINIAMTYGNVGGTVSPIAAKTGTTAPLVAEVGLNVNARISGMQAGADEAFRLLAGAPGPDTYSPLVQTPHRREDFYKSLRGRSFRVGSGRALVQGIAAFVATTPDILIVPAATNEWILKSIRVWTLTQTGTVRVRIVNDPDDRFSAGGTTRTPVNRNLGSAATDTPTRCLDGGPVGAATPITATAEDADERDSGDKFITAAFGEALFSREDGDIISPAGSILVYVNDNAGATAPTFGWEIEYELANIQ